jgi:hypothetical protein
MEGFNPTHDPKEQMSPERVEGGSNPSESIKSAKQGDCIGLLDLAHGSLTVFLNERRIGVAVTGLRGRYRGSRYCTTVYACGLGRGRYLRRLAVK